MLTTWARRARAGVLGGLTVLVLSLGLAVPASAAYSVSGPLGGGTLTVTIKEVNFLDAVPPNGWQMLADLHYTGPTGQFTNSKEWQLWYLCPAGAELNANTWAPATNGQGSFFYNSVQHGTVVSVDYRSKSACGGLSSSKPVSWRIQARTDGAIVVAATAYQGTPAPPPPPAARPACVIPDAQLVALARLAGWTGSSVTTAVAVALAESSGNATVIGGPNTDGTYDLGLWQINTGAHPSYDKDQLLDDPVYNAGAAFAIFTDAGGWSPWVAYNTGAHRKFLERAAAAVAAPEQPWSGSCTNGTPSGAPGGDATDGTQPCDGWNVLTWLRCAFEPDPATLGRFSSVGDELTTAVPFGYVLPLVDGFSSMAGRCTAPPETAGVNDCSAYHEGFRVPVPSTLGGGDVTLLSPDDNFVQWMRGDITRQTLGAVIWLMCLSPLFVLVWRRSLPVVGGDQ